MKQAVARETVETLLAAEPPVRSRTIATGFTANPDLLLAGGPALTAQMHQWRATGTAAEAVVWQAILDEQVRCAATGRGDELTLEPAEVLRRFDAHGRAMTIGGTGVRAAAQAARLGQRTIVSIPAADPRLASLLGVCNTPLPGPLLSLIPTPSPAPGARLPVHYIIELPAPHSRRGPGGAKQRANRLILHGDEAWLPLLPDAFIAHIAAAVPPARLLLLSGFNIYTRLPELDQALAHARHWLQTVRRRVPQLWIYLEMAGFTTPTALRRVLGEIGPLVHAVGMNEDEFALAADLAHALREMPPSAQILLMHEAMTRYALGRLVVHTAWASSYVGRAPLAPTERTTAARALAWGHMAAGFRYAHGYDGALSELRCAAHAWTPVPEGMDCAAAASGRSDMVLIPAWHIPRGVGTIGLGDSFTGAFLTGLDPPVPCADAPRQRRSTRVTTDVERVSSP
jgi:ADP-dependent phosphofructokinase/glucokinase